MQCKACNCVYCLRMQSVTSRNASRVHGDKFLLKWKPQFRGMNIVRRRRNSVMETEANLDALQRNNGEYRCMHRQLATHWNLGKCDAASKIRLSSRLGRWRKNAAAVRMLPNAAGVARCRPSIRMAKKEVAQLHEIRAYKRSRCILRLISLTVMCPL